MPDAEPDCDGTALDCYLLALGLILGWLVRAGRLTVTGGLTVTRGLGVTRRRRRPKAGCLLARLERRPIAEELDDHKNRKYEHVVKEQVVPATEEKKQVETINQKGCAEHNVPYSPRRSLPGPDAGHNEHRGATDDEEQDINVEHLGYPAVYVTLPCLGR